MGADVGGRASGGRRLLDTRVCGDDSDTSSSACSCSSCDAYRERKASLRGAMRRYRAVDRDDSGEEAYENGWLTERFGKYGVLDAVRAKMEKAEEFQLWLREVHGAAWEELSTYDEKRFWEEFVERFNTATLPSKRYYNAQLQRRGAAPAAAAAAVGDEDARRAAARALRDRERELEVARALAEMQEDSGIAQDMRKLQELKVRAAFKFRTGDVEEARGMVAALHKLPPAPAPPHDPNGEDD